MSGIVGIYHPDGKPVDPMDLQRMVDRLAHRGPDGRHIWYEGSVGFGHCMLHTTPESLHEKFPMTSRCGNFVLTADARIDNRDELISALRPSRSNGHPITDGELILLAYEKWGEDCPKHLLGDFAFAIWDKRDHRQFLARDPMGVRALYYSTVGGSLYFASEIKSLLVLQEIPRRLNETKIADFLIPLHHDQESTFYKDIRRLPPAHTAVFASGLLRKQRYWELDPARELRLSSDGDYVDAFQALFTEAVRCRLRSAYPVGSTLSGGLDSSSVTVVAGKLVQDRSARVPDDQSRLHTISAIFPSVIENDRRIDERAYMDAVIASGAFEPHFVRADEGGLLEHVRWHTDEPLPAPGAYLGRTILAAAKQEGLRVVLCGLDGDSTVSYGFERLSDLARRGDWTTFAAECSALVDFQGGKHTAYLRQWGFPELTALAESAQWLTLLKQAGHVSRLFNTSRITVLAETSLRQLVPEWMLHLRRRLKGSEATHAAWTGRNATIRPEFAERIQLDRRLEETHRLGGFTDAREFRYDHIQNLTDGLWEFGLNIYDLVAADRGVEQRYPFFDRRLMEFCVALPFDQKLRNGHTRRILRRALEDLLPDTVAHRSGKGYLGANMKARLVNDLPALDGFVNTSNVYLLKEYIAIDKLREMYRGVKKSPVTDVTGVFPVFLAAALAQWLADEQDTPITVHSLNGRAVDHVGRIDARIYA